MVRVGEFNDALKASREATRIRNERKELQAFREQALRDATTPANVRPPVKHFCELCGSHFAYATYLMVPDEGEPILCYRCAGKQCAHECPPCRICVDLQKKKTSRR
jgi:hypothetical protein